MAYEWGEERKNISWVVVVPHTPAHEDGCILRDVTYAETAPIKAGAEKKNQLIPIARNKVLF